MFCGTCLHGIGPIRPGDSGSAIYDTLDPDARVVAFHVGGNTLDDERGIGAFVQSTYVYQAPTRVQLLRARARMTVLPRTQN